MIRKMQEKDWQQVAAIYKDGFETGNATFQQEIPSWKEWDAGHLACCRLVIEIRRQIIGWAALSSVSKRIVYSGVAEVSVYVSGPFRGNGIGTILLGALVAASEKENIWTLQAGIFPENKGSLEMHRKAGFREVGYRERIGEMNGKWRDTVLLERRSLTVGV